MLDETPTTISFDYSYEIQIVRPLSLSERSKQTNSSFAVSPYTPHDALSINREPLTL